MLICYGIMIITVCLSIAAFGQYSFFEKAKFNPWSIAHRKEYWRWVTGGFVHADYMHLIVNMLSLYFFGPMTEQYFIYIFGSPGSLLFLLMYTLSIPLSSMYAYYKHKNNFAYSAIGASGAVCAVMFSGILFSPRSEICLYFAICIPAWVFGILYLVYEYYMNKKQVDNTAHDAHFFGALFGIIFTIISYPDVIQHFISQFTSL